MKQWLREQDHVRGARTRRGGRRHVTRRLRRVSPGVATGRELGPYTLQAAIAACHTRERTAAGTDWPRIVALYDALVERTGPPVVELNRAVAVGMAFGAAEGLELVDDLASDPALAITRTARVVWLEPWSLPRGTRREPAARSEVSERSRHAASAGQGSPTTPAPHSAPRRGASLRSMDGPFAGSGDRSAATEGVASVMPPTHQGLAPAITPPDARAARLGSACLASTLLIYATSCIAPGTRCGQRRSAIGPSRRARSVR